jgi:hypothetical protein
VGGLLKLKLCTGLALAAFLLLAVPASGAGTLFGPYTAIPVGSWPEAVAIGDVTGDGRSDVVMTTSYYFDPASDYRLWVFAQTTDGSLSAPVSYATSGSYTQRPESVGIGDITGDGAADVVVGLSGLGVQVFPQLGSGMLGDPTLAPTINAGKIRIGQLDGDGRLDVAGVGWGTNTVGVLLNDGAGGLRPPVSYPAQHAGYEDLEVADVTGDGRHDLVVMSGQSYAVPNISVLEQLAAGGFGPPAEYRVGTNVNTHGIGVGDVTGDGLADVIASYGGNRPSSFIGVFAQTTGGTLAAPVSYPSYDIPEPVESADVDLDGRADVVTLHGGWNRAGVYAKQAAGPALAAEDLYPLPYASHYNPHGLAVGDVDGDASPDLVLADYNNGLVVLRGTATPPPPPPPPAADLSVDVVATAATVKQRKPFAFVVTMTNAGPDSSSATLVASLEGPASNLEVDTAGCAVSGSTVTCTLGPLGRGAATSIRITGTATRKGTLVATAEVDGELPDPETANDTDSASTLVR